METFLRFLLILHIAAGTTALATGLVAIVTRKGGRPHKRSGEVFFWCMVAVAVTALVISGIKGNAFLTHIALFSLYMAHAGRRSIHNKTLRPAVQDRTMLAVGAINGIWMASTLNVVLVVFGGISILLAGTDLRTFIRTSRGGVAPPMAWLQRHIGMMLGTYIATTTAFLLTALRSLELGWWLWLAPTFLGVPLIIWSTWRFTPRRKERPTPA